MHQELYLTGNLRPIKNLISQIVNLLSVGFTSMSAYGLTIFALPLPSEPGLAD